MVAVFGGFPQKAGSAEGKMAATLLPAEVWAGEVAVVFQLARGDLMTEVKPQEHYVMANRVGYLHLVAAVR